MVMICPMSWRPNGYDAAALAYLLVDRHGKPARATLSLGAKFADWRSFFRTDVERLGVSAHLTMRNKTPIGTYDGSVSTCERIVLRRDPISSERPIAPVFACSHRRRCHFAGAREFAIIIGNFLYRGTALHARTRTW
jgi:hypothetical protein